MSRRSFWESFGEAIGYGLAALVLGPAAAISRSERRRVRRSFVAWCDEHGAEKREGSRGVLRRAIALDTKTGKTPADVELHAFERRALFDVAIPPLPNWVRAKIVWENGVKVESETLDAPGRRALEEHVARSSLGELRVVWIGVTSERLEVVVIAVTTVEAWRSIGEAVVALADWLVERWPVGYRG